MFFEVLSLFSFFIVRIAFCYLFLMFGTLMIAKAKLDSLFHRAKGYGVLALWCIAFLCYCTMGKPLFTQQQGETGKISVRIARWITVQSATFHKVSHYPKGTNGFSGGAGGFEKEKQGMYGVRTSCRFPLLPCLSQPFQKPKTPAYFWA